MRGCHCWVDLSGFWADCSSYGWNSKGLGDTGDWGRGFGGRLRLFTFLGLSLLTANDSVINVSGAMLRFSRQQYSCEHEELGTDIFCSSPAIHQAVCFACPDAHTKLHRFLEKEG